MRTRIIVVPLVTMPSGQVLLCRMAEGRGVFPGQWALPGGGVEPGERLEEALRREALEELGIALKSVTPLFFKDAVLEKSFADGTKEPLHMIFLVYRCAPETLDIHLNEEFSEYIWADSHALRALDLSSLTRETLASAGFIRDDAVGAG